MKIVVSKFGDFNETLLAYARNAAIILEYMLYFSSVTVRLLCLIG